MYMLLERQKIQLALSIKQRPVLSSKDNWNNYSNKTTDVGDSKLLRTKANYLISFLSSAAYTLHIITQSLKSES